MLNCKKSDVMIVCSIFCTYISCVLIYISCAHVSILCACIYFVRMYLFYAYINFVCLYLFCVLISILCAYIYLVCIYSFCEHNIYPFCAHVLVLCTYLIFCEHIILSLLYVYIFMWKLFILCAYLYQFCDYKVERGGGIYVLTTYDTIYSMGTLNSEICIIRMNECVFPRAISLYSHIITIYRPLEKHCRQTKSIFKKKTYFQLLYSEIVKHVTKCKTNMNGFRLNIFYSKDTDWAG